MTALPTTDGVFRAIRTPAYLILTLALALPLLDYANGLLPVHVGDPLWRFGATSLVASYAMATTVQLFFLFVVAVAAGDRKVLTAIAAVALIMAVSLFGASGLYVLDALQTRARTSAGTQFRLETTAAVVMLKLLCLVAACGVLARASMRASRQIRNAPVKPDQVLARRPLAGTPPRV